MTGAGGRGSARANANIKSNISRAVRGRSAAGIALSAFSVVLFIFNIN